MDTSELVLPTAGEIMNHNVESFRADMPVGQAIEILLRRGFSGAPVVDEARCPIGVLSEHDCLRALADSLYEGWPSGTVGDHMSKAVEFVDVDADVLVVTSTFTNGTHRRLPVVRNGRLVGLITRRDLMLGLDRLMRQLAEQRELSTYELIEAHGRQ